MAGAASCSRIRKNAGKRHPRILANAATSPLASCAKSGRVTMQVEWACPTCAARLRADSKMSLRRIRCPKCQNETVVPKPAAPPRVAPAGETTSLDQQSDDEMSFAPPASDPLAGQWADITGATGEADW